ncbi:MAG TPA: N-acetylmuramidase domain-containing protein [Allosphingosinicella sp.]|jgi:hypothetical protein
MTLIELQRWLNARGADLVADGKPGPKTRGAILTGFSNRSAPAVTTEEIAAFARRLGGSVKQVRAVAAVESNGGGFNHAGQPKALFERHYAWRRLRIKIPFLSNPTPGGYTIDADHDGICDSWEKIADLAMRNPLAAFESASFGKFQIMGAWAEKLGYGNAIEFAYALSRSEAAHYEALCRYIEVFGGVAKFRALSPSPLQCRPFAEFFNGRGQKGYDGRLAREMR